MTRSIRKTLGKSPAWKSAQTRSPLLLQRGVGRGWAGGAWVRKDRIFQTWKFATAARVSIADRGGHPGEVQSISRGDQYCRSAAGFTGFSAIGGICEAAALAPYGAPPLRKGPGSATGAVTRCGVADEPGAARSRLNTCRGFVERPTGSGPYPSPTVRDKSPPPLHILKGPFTFAHSGAGESIFRTHARLICDLRRKRASRAGYRGRVG